MDFADPHQRRVFFELHAGLPREGPGDAESTARALALARPLPDRARVLDLACGPGAQTLDLARLLPGAEITALDLHGPFVEETARRIAAAGYGDRVRAARGDMRAPPEARGGYDLIWCEGAVYMLGVVEALTLWRGLLETGGRIAFTEPVFLTASPSPPVAANWAEYPAMAQVDAVRAWIAEAGLTLIGDFLLPEAAWWRDYYGPLDERRTALERVYERDPVARSVLAEARSEVEVYRAYSAEFGYQFFVAGL